MQEHEYKARDKTVQKMSRDGLREENLRSKKEKRITRREADEKKTAGHREQELDFGKARKAHTAEEPVEEGTEGKHRLQSRHAFLEQEELAEALFVSRTAISKWESGRGVPNIESLKAISKFFSVSIDELLSGEEILKIADEDNKQKEKHTRDLVFGLLDCSLIMFLFLPFFGQKGDEIIKEVSLLSLTGTPQYIKIPYLIMTP